MARPDGWDALWDCPKARPYWCSRPHCLWCNWDRYDSDEWTVAAHLGERPLDERHYDPKYPEGHYVEDRFYVAWLCYECAEYEEQRDWFVRCVQECYPAAVLVRLPGSVDESLVPGSL